MIAQNENNSTLKIFQITVHNMVHVIKFAFLFKLKLGKVSLISLTTYTLQAYNHTSPPPQMPTRTIGGR